ncbi:glycerophosphodiester phosphodiesterase family protein [Hirschia maritima]|uniref:glycerophosphodiester phosphodiesterase family protein n=1 Tax=Hirschia maritima TaxID=1121961 RepID=UPI00035D9B3E|nr:glycerophosphodiester phosphodiesterase family protein [Hirschia maritima]
MRLLPLLLGATAIFAASCSNSVDENLNNNSTEDNNSQTSTVSQNSLQNKFNCIRENGGLAAAHRGGPRRGYPENALETLQASYDNGARVFEIDVAESKDGVLFLLHDTSLDRTTEAEGVARELDWKELKKVRLKANGEITSFTIPSLKDTLKWAKANNAILELDKKRSSKFEAIISEIRKADAEDNVVLITYTYDQAAEVARLAPDMMMTASVSDPSDVKTLEGKGVKRANLIAWTGTDTLNPGLWSDLNELGIEVAFGTLGRRGQRFDDTFWEDRDGSEYDELIENGVTLIATDYSDRVSKHLKVDDIAIEKCNL